MASFYHDPYDGAFSSNYLDFRNPDGDEPYANDWYAEDPREDLYQGGHPFGGPMYDDELSSPSGYGPDRCDHYFGYDHGYDHGRYGGDDQYGAHFASGQKAYSSYRYEARSEYRDEPHGGFESPRGSMAYEDDRHYSGYDGDPYRVRRSGFQQPYSSSGGHAFDDDSYRSPHASYRQPYGTARTYAFDDMARNPQNALYSNPRCRRSSPPPHSSERDAFGDVFGRANDIKNVYARSGMPDMPTPSARAASPLFSGRTRTLERQHRGSIWRDPSTGARPEVFTGVSGAGWLGEDPWDLPRAGGTGESSGRSRAERHRGLRDRIRNFGEEGSGGYC